MFERPKRRWSKKIVRGIRYAFLVATSTSNSYPRKTETEPLPTTVPQRFDGTITFLYCINFEIRLKQEVFL